MNDVPGVRNNDVYDDKVPTYFLYILYIFYILVIYYINNILYTGCTNNLNLKRIFITKIL